MRFSSVLFALGCLPYASPAFSQSVPAPSSWLLSYQGKSTNELVSDHRIKKLVETRVPALLSDSLASALGGPPDPVFIVDHRYVSISACRPHSCDEKGFLWVDTQTGIGLGAYYLAGDLLLGSNGLSARTIPPPAKRALIAWLREGDLATKSAAFADGAGERTPLDAADFQAPERFHPPATGPAFDCRLASSGIEKAICGDSGLAKQDLALGQLYREIRRGSGTTVAQDQLLALQRGWLKERDGECGHAVDMAACLKASYDAQYERLRNWIPVMRPAGH